MSSNPDITCPAIVTEETITARSIYVEGRPRKLWIPAGSVVPNYRIFNVEIKSVGQDWITGNPSDTRYYLSYSATIGTERDATAEAINLTLKCGTSRYYNEATITGTRFLQFPQSSLITLEEDLILYEE